MRSSRSASSDRPPLPACTTFCRALCQSFLYDPAPTRDELAVAVRRVLCRRRDSRQPEAHDVARLSRRILHRLERGARPRRELHVHQWRDFERAAHWRIVLHQPTMRNSCRSRASAWPGVPSASKTVLRAGFGMYNDLQDALGYRADQNAPFNPVYSIAALPVSQFPIDPAGPRPRKREAGAGRSAAGHEDADADFVVAARGARTFAQHVADRRLRRLARLSRTDRRGCQRVRFRSICPASPCPAVYPTSDPAATPRIISNWISHWLAARGHAGSRWQLFHSRRARRKRIRPSPTPGRGFPRAPAPTTRCKWICAAASATDFRCAAFTPFQRRWTTAIR